jgi:hypothetical protein
VLLAADTTAPVFPGGLETSGVIPSTGIGGAFPDTQVAAREGTSAEASGTPQPIMINGKICLKCP